MKITQEADYALRITSVLAMSEKPIGAPTVADRVAVPQRFAMKILRKLSLKGIVKSTRGVAGGYSLSTAAEELSLKRVIEAIDGRIAIRHCLCEEHVCTNSSDKSKCRFHNAFAYLNNLITERLDRLSIADMINPELSTEQIIEKLK